MPLGTSIPLLAPESPARGDRRSPADGHRVSPRRPKTCPFQRAGARHQQSEQDLPRKRVPPGGKRPPVEFRRVRFREQVPGIGTCWCRMCAGLVEGAGVRLRQQVPGTGTRIETCPEKRSARPVRASSRVLSCPLRTPGARHRHLFVPNVCRLSGRCRGTRAGSRRPRTARRSSRAPGTGRMERPSCGRPCRTSRAGRSRGRLPRTSRA